MNDNHSSDRQHLSVVGDGDSVGTPIERKLAILYSGNDYECGLLAKDPEIDLTIIQNLFPKFPQELLENSALQQATQHSSSFVIQLFLDHKHLISHLRLNEDWSKYLLHHPDPEVRQIAASNRTLPEGLWNFCTYHHDVFVRMGMANNESLGYGNLAQLSGDSSDLVRKVAEAQMKIRFPVVTKLPAASQEERDFSFQDGSPNTIILEKPDSITSLETKVHPIAFIVVFLGMICTALILVLFNQNHPPIESLAGRGLSTNAYDPHKLLEQAIVLANEATVRSKKPDLSKQELTSIANSWRAAISHLEQIEKGSTEYPDAQQKLLNYRNILAIVEGKAKASR